MRMEDVLEKRLVEQTARSDAGGVADEHLEDLESRPARRADAAAHHLARRPRPRLPGRSDAMVWKVPRSS